MTKQAFAKRGMSKLTPEDFGFLKFIANGRRWKSESRLSARLVAR